MRIATVLAVSMCWAASAEAQVLRLKNTDESNTIVMKYLSRSERPKTMKEVSIPAGGTRAITLYGQDPYDVSFYLKPKKDQNGKTQVFHAKVGRPIPLRSLAGRGTFDVSIVLAAKSAPSGLIYQGTMAELAAGNNRFKVFGPAESAPAFSKQILGRRWDTSYRAGDGNTYNASVDFGNLKFSTDSFTGRFTDLAVFEDDSTVHVVGKWSALDSRGDVFFTVRKNAPHSLQGEYTFAGRHDRYFWRSH